MAKISVIVPVYNAEKYLNKCLTSLVNQTEKDLEIIVINDGSTDSSLSIIEDFRTSNKGKMIVVDTKNGGAGSARNKGLSLANGEFIKFVDADDYLSLDILEKMYTVAKDTNVKLVRGNYKIVVGPFRLSDTCSWSGIKETRLVDVRENKDYIVTETCGIGNKLISRELIGDLRFPEGRKWEDLAIIPVVLADQEKIFHMNEEVYNYRVNMNTTMKDFIKRIPKVFDIIISLEYMKKEMKKRNLDIEYAKQIEGMYILHTLYRVENIMHWVDVSIEKKKEIISLLLSVLDLKYPNWRENELVERYKIKNPFFGIDINRIYNFNYYKKDDENIFNYEKEIVKMLK